MNDKIQTLKDILLSAKEEFNKIDNSGRFEQEYNFMLQIISNNDYLLKLALSNSESTKNILINVASFKTTLNQAEKKAYLVPKNNKIDLTISHIGLINIAILDKSIVWAQSKLVYDNDDFSIRGYDNAPIHKYNPFSSNRGNIVGVYCVAKLPNGDYITETMDIKEIEKIKRCSPSNNKPSSPWNTFFTEMARKAVIKRAAKYWQSTSTLSKAIEYLNNEAGEGIETIEKKDKNKNDLQEIKKEIMGKLLNLGIDRQTMAIFLSQNNIKTDDIEELKKFAADDLKIKKLVNDFLSDSEEEQKENDEIFQERRIKKSTNSETEALYNLFKENGITTKENQEKFAKFIKCDINNAKHVSLWINSKDQMSEKALEFYAISTYKEPTIDEIENDQSDLVF